MPMRVADEIAKALRIPRGGISVPLNRFGSKARLARRLVNMLPEHTVYVEVFGGTAAVLLAKPISPIEVYNDIDGEITNFFTVLREKPGELIARCFLQPYARADFLKYKDEPLPDDPVERAARYMFLVSSAFRFHDYNNNTFSTHISMSGSHASSSANRWVAKVNRLVWFALRFRDVIIENRDFEEVIHIYDRPETVFFCDPPYTRGTFSWSFAEHLRLARRLKNIKGKFLLIIDDSPLSRQLYKDYNLIAVIKTLNGMSTRDGGQAEYYQHLCFANYDYDIEGAPEVEGDAPEDEQQP